MNADVICMALGRVPAGEQRSRFLAVGLSDNTVSIISLDPNVSDPSVSLTCRNCRLTSVLVYQQIT